VIRLQSTGWQATMIDLSLILFLLTSAALSQAGPGEKGAAAPVDADGDNASAVYDAGPDAPDFPQWLAEQQPDPRQRLTMTSQQAVAGKAANRHAALLHRASAVLSCFTRRTDLVVTDEAELGAPATPGSIGLTRAAAPKLARAKQGGITLAYADPESEATLGALLAAAGERDTPVGADPESLSLLSLAERLASSDIPVLINGPTGTGKEVLSRFIHSRSPRADGPFIAINCAAMPEAMLEAMLFGHQKGAFTGASAAGEGFFRAADGGTLLLDEIAEMPLGLQAIPRDAMLTKLQDVTDRGSHMAGKQREIAEARAQMRRLSSREREVLSDLSQGLSNKEIAMHLGISPRTVEIHRSNLITKIGAKSSAHAIRIAIRGDLD
jgi:DNA-binding NarL/FixJ family response regulator